MTKIIKWAYVRDQFWPLFLLIFTILNMHDIFKLIFNIQIGTPKSKQGCSKIEYAFIHCLIPKKATKPKTIQNLQS